MITRVIFAATLAWTVLAAPAVAATYIGTSPAPAVVWISDGSKPVIPSGELLLRQTQKHFVPDVLVVPLGAMVRFPNDDAFYHNVYSEGAAQPFDLGLYDAGPGKTVTFDRAGIADVRCHIHVLMHATVLVVDGPSLRVERAGRYQLDGVKPGRHTLHVWTVDGGEHRELVTV